MAELDFYNLTSQIAYPLCDPQGTLPVSCLCDAGFVIGPESGFNPSTDKIYLYGVDGNETSVKFEFRTTAANLSGYRWIFTFLTDSDFGAAQSRPLQDALFAEHPELGEAFLVVGNLSALVGVTAFPGAAANPPKIEPALIQLLDGAVVTSLSLANTQMPCPPIPRGSSSSSDSSSTSSSSGDVEPNPADAVFVESEGHAGEIVFSAGYNVRLAVDTQANALQFIPSKGFGAGEPCHAIQVTASGITETDCVVCNESIQSVNGISTPGGELFIRGSTGITVVDDQATHTITITMDLAKQQCSGVTPSSSLSLNSSSTADTASCAECPVRDGYSVLVSGAPPAAFVAANPTLASALSNGQMAIGDINRGAYTYFTSLSTPSGSIEYNYTLSCLGSGAWLLMMEVTTRDNIGGGVFAVTTVRFSSTGELNCIGGLPDGVLTGTNCYTEYYEETGSGRSDTVTTLYGAGGTARVSTELGN